MSDAETVALVSASCVSEQLFSISRMGDTFWVVVLLRRSCKTHGELSVSQCEREGKDGRHMASQNFRYPGYRKVTEAFGYSLKYTIRGICLTKEWGEGGGVL